MTYARRDAARLLAVSALVLSAACSDPITSSPQVAAPGGARMDVVPTPAQVVIAGVDGGSFTGNVDPNNSGRATTEFWDNLSADNTGLNTSCNIGFYARGTFGANCLNEGGAAGSTSNAAGNNYTKYWGDGTNGRDASSFMLNGTYTYTVTLKGSFVALKSEVGWFTRNADGSIDAHAVQAWSDRSIGSSVQINPALTGGKPWGFYIKNGFNSNSGGCAADTDCSDATGGFTAIPFQQFALMLDPSNNGRYLVGAEDNRLELLASNTEFLDSDYNDYIWSFEVAAVPEAICDFVTFGRLVTELTNGTKVVVSGNAGGNQPGGGILGEFHVDIDGTDYHVHDINSYGPITSGALNGLTNSRVVTGTAKNGIAVELRLYDGGEPGKGTDRVYVRIGGALGVGGLGGTEYLSAAGKLIDQGNMQYHANCRGPK